LPLKLQSEDPGVTAARFFSQAEVRAEKQAGPGEQASYQFTSGKEWLDISSNGILTYRNDAIRVKDDSPKISLEQAKGIAEEFIKQHLGGMPKDVRLGYAEAGNTAAASHHLTYNQYVNSVPISPVPIFDAYIDMDVTADGVALMTRRWPQPSGWSSTFATIASASDILLRLVQDPLFKEAAARAVGGKQDAQIVIKEITLGYYSALDPNVESTAFPAWRVVLAQGDEFIYNALTGLREYPGIVP
ncbi:MAG: YcdB/YcdC domain-containing protein, partial [Bacillota bacterium]